MHFKAPHIGQKTVQTAKVGAAFLLGTFLLSSDITIKPTRNEWIGPPNKTILRTGAKLSLSDWNEQDDWNYACDYGFGECGRLSLTENGGDKVFLMQTDSTYRMPTVRKDTVKTMDTVPQIVKPDVRTLEHYNPWPGVLNDSTFTKMDKLSIQAYRSSWMSMEDNYPPFGLPKKVVDSYSPEEKKELLRLWEIAKTELRVAFLSDKGATPANAFKVHTPEEIQKMLETWQDIKELRNQKITRPPVQ